jgi:glycerol-3-phosphate dehydrogenase (NAD(P)+)
VRIAVIGAGAWGTALAKVLSENELDVTLWCREEDVRRSIVERRENSRFLPEIGLPARLHATTDLEKAAQGREVLLLAVPSPYLRAVATEVSPFASGVKRVVSATKGLEEATHIRMSEVISETFESVAPIVLSGPTFAREVAFGEPTALVAASGNLEGAKEIQERFSTPTFRIYTNDDVLGVELGGALKNVVALAVGVATGLGLGHNPKAALMTRGLAEIARLVEAMGGRRETLFGLAGMGDLVLTCTGLLSRNRQVGIELGKGRKLEDILAGMEQVAEGVRTTHAAVALAEEHGVEMPIAVQMDRLLRGHTTPEDVMRELMTRPLRPE